MSTTTKLLVPGKSNTLNVKNTTEGYTMEVDRQRNEQRRSVMTITHFQEHFKSELGYKLINYLVI